MDRFERVYKQGTIDVIEIWVDRETGVQYLWRDRGPGGGLTPLLDANGKPLLAKGKLTPID